WSVKRLQFPLRLGYTSTFDSAQGKTLGQVEIDLTQPIFTHEQLCTITSRVQNRQGHLVRRRINSTTVPNVVFPEFL
ncbi:hypothetical protein BS47DRAFT_1249186, partial [Hydnum rufescens UP504]